MLQRTRDKSIGRFCAAAVSAAIIAGLMVRVSASSGTSGLRTGEAGDAMPDRIRVQIALISTPADRATGTGKVLTRSIMVPGQQKTWYIGADVGLTGHLCAGGTAFEPLTDVAVRWRVDVTVLETSPTKAALGVTWERSRLREGTYVEEARGGHTVELDLGQYQVLDYVADPGSPSCSNVLLELSAEVEPVAEPQATLVYDLWLEYDGRLGGRWEHRQVTARSGVQIPFRFDAMEWAVEQATSEVPLGPIRLEVRGTLMGRLRDNGFVDVALRTVRDLGWGEGSSGGFGDLDYRAALGEAASVVLPDPKNVFRRNYSPRAAIVSPGATFRGGVWVLDAKQFLGGTFTLYVSVTRQP